MRRLLSLSLPLLLGVSAVALPAAPPNFIVLFADDQGWGDLGAYGHPDIRTPHIDRMAAEGMRLTSFYAAPFCGPSRAALMTGSYPPRASLDFNHGPEATTGIHADEITVAELLSGNGYATKMIGKWHLGDAPEFLPHRHGFDSWFGIPYSNDMWRYHPVMPIRHPENERMISARQRAAMTGFAGQGSYYDLERGQGFPQPLPLMRDDEVLETDSDQRNLTTLYTELALDFIEESKDGPFFLYLPHAMPHVPLFVNDRRWGKSLRGRYGDVIEELDWSVGQILGKLAELGLDRNTLVVYTSDNGPWLQYGIDGGSAGPFKLGKGTTWEGGMRVPGIFWMPGRIPAGQVSSAVAANMDILPTFAGLAGAELPTDRVLDGRDLWPLLSGATDESPHEYFYFFAGRGRQRQARLQGIRKGRHKLRLTAGADGQLVAGELYDLYADAAEKFDISSRHADLVEQLLDQARAFLAELGQSTRPLGGT
ncbi:MAG: sulfatase [Bryobacterales bacterium]|nr:sulfatase [Bryobacterales bacterium]